MAQTDETQGLTSYDNSAPAEIETTPTHDAVLNKLGNPYEDQDMTAVLTRTYKVKHFTWSPSSPAGTPIGFAQFPEDLFAIPNIAAKLENFKWFRADVQYSVVINATKFHIGTLNVSHQSSTFQGDGRFLDRWIRLNSNSMIITASSTNTVKRDLRRTAPVVWDKIHNGVPYSIGTVWIDVRDALLTLAGGSPTPLDVCVFANFVNPKVAGYGYTTPSPAALTRKFQELKFAGETSKHSATKKKQNDPVAKEAEKKSSSGIISSMVEATGALAPLFLMTPFPEVAPVLGAVSKTAPFLRSMGLSKPVSVQVSEPTHLDPYRDLVHTHGLSQGVKLSAQPTATLADTSLCELKRHTIKEMIERPGHLTAFTIDALTPIDQTVKKFPVFPGLSGNRPGQPKLVYPTHLAHLSQYFTNWRGGIKFRFEFTTSELTTTRVRLTHYPDDTEPPDIEDYAGDMISDVIDIRGNTVKEFTLPYMSPFPYLPVMGVWKDGDPLTHNRGGELVFPQTPWLGFSLVNSVSIPDPGGISTIYVNVYVSAAEDMTLIGYQGFNLRLAACVTLPTFKKLEAPSGTKKHSLEEVFSKPFQPLVPAMAQCEEGLVSIETVNTIEEMLKRFEPWGQAAAGPLDINLSDGHYLFENSKVTNSGQLLTMFKWWRGSVRYKLGPDVFLGDEKIVSYRPFGDMTFADMLGENLYTTLNVCGNQESPIEFEVPWNYPTYAMYLANIDESFFFDLGNLSKPTLKSQNPLPATNWRAMGEDFLLGQVLPVHSYDFSLLPLEEDENPAAPLQDKGKTRAAESSSAVKR